jgi:hypothetical protein
MNWKTIEITSYCGLIKAVPLIWERPFFMGDDVRILFRWIFIAAIALLMASQVCSAAQFQDIGLSVAYGVRSDALIWSTSGNTLEGEIDTLSELDWDDVTINQLQLRVDGTIADIARLERDFYFACSLALGSISSGGVRDSDYAGDDSSLEWSRSESDAGDGDSFDLSVEIGPILHFRDSRIQVVPVVGLEFDYLGLVLQDGYQVLSDSAIRSENFGDKASLPVAVGPIEGLDSSYSASWYGPFLGVRLRAPLSSKFSLTTALDYHLTLFSAEADWNLRDDLEHPVSFEQEGVGGGLSLSLQALYLLGERWALELNGSTRFWTLFSGSSKTNLIDGNSIETDLNDVNWSSHSLSAGLRYCF